MSMWGNKGSEINFWVSEYCVLIGTASESFSYKCIFRLRRTTWTDSWKSLNQKHLCSLSDLCTLVNRRFNLMQHQSHPWTLYISHSVTPQSIRSVTLCPDVTEPYLSVYLPFCGLFLTLPAVSRFLYFIYCLLITWTVPHFHFCYCPKHFGSVHLSINKTAFVKDNRVKPWIINSMHQASQLTQPTSDILVWSSGVYACECIYCI